MPDVDKHKEKDPSKRRSYNVREYNGYPRTNAQDRKMVPVREVVIRRTAIADDSHCRTCGYMLSGITDRHDKVTEDVHGGKMLGTSWKGHPEVLQGVRQAADVPACRGAARRALRDRHHVAGNHAGMQDKLV